MSYLYDEAISAGVFDVSIIAVLVLLSVGIYVSYKKLGYLNDTRNLIEAHKDSLREVTWKVPLYMFSFPPMMLMVIGASTLTANAPVWRVPSLLIIVTVQLAFVLYLALFPLLRIGFTTSALGAAAINEYVKKIYPLQHYESKVCRIQG